MIVTINTDASFSRRHKMGSFAFWIVCDEFKITKSGLLKNSVHRPEIAEFRCLINAIHVLSKNETRRITKVIVNTDCLNVIHLVNQDNLAISKYRLRDWGKHYVGLFRKMLNDKKLLGKVEMRHVKAHSGINDKRSFVNEWCDSEAKRILGQAIEAKIISK